METVTMSHRELDRVGVMRRLHERRLRQLEAARMLGLTVRQVRRLHVAYRKDGPEALASKLRGRRSNRRLPETLRQEALELVRGRYADFGPTLAWEKLTELHGFELSVPTLRKWMIEDGIWVPRSCRDKRVQQPRVRRACFGELVQIDGSDHEWFEDRAPRCTLLVYIDDATSRLMTLRFCASETTFDYFVATRQYLESYGKPVAFYSDKATIFRVNRAELLRGDGLTQFGRAKGDLNIDTICANTAAAKGRVERANQTLQDRLVKELRLRGISTMDGANEFAPEFMADHNRRFGREPRSRHDAHRSLLAHEKLDDIFTFQEQRKVSKELTLRYKRVLYLLAPSDFSRAARGKGVDVYETREGAVTFRFKGQELPGRAFPRDNRVEQGAIVENKRLGDVLRLIQAQQKERDAEHQTSRHLTLRSKRLLQRTKPRRTGEVPSPVRE
jgi:hypothetical protein